MTKMISLFHENTPQIVAALRDAVAGNDASSVAASAHKLLESLGAFGAARGRQLTMQLEKQGELNELERSNETLTELEREIDQIYLALADFGVAA